MHTSLEPPQDISAAYKRHKEAIKVCWRSTFVTDDQPLIITPSLD